MSRADKQDFDLKALLTAVLDDVPSDEFTEHLVARLALVSTAVEFFKLVGVVPVQATMSIASGVTDEEGENADDDATD